MLFRALNKYGYYFHLEQLSRDHGVNTGHALQPHGTTSPKGVGFMRVPQRTKKAVRRAMLDQEEGKRRCSGRPEGMNLRIVMNTSAGITMVTSSLFPYTAEKRYCQKICTRVTRQLHEWFNLSRFDDNDGSIHIFVHVFVWFPHEDSNMCSSMNFWCETDDVVTSFFSMIDQFTYKKRTACFLAWSWDTNTATQENTPVCDAKQAP